MTEKQIVLTLENKNSSHNGRGVVEALAPRERFYDIKRGEGRLSDISHDVVRACLKSGGRTCRKSGVILQKRDC